MVKHYLFCGLLFLTVGCQRVANQSPASKPHRYQIYTTSYPLFFVAQRLCTNQADVLFPAPANEDPAFRRPSKEVIRQYQQADLVLLNGAAFEKWVETTSLPLNTLVDTAAAFKDQWIMFPEVITHSHGPQGAHSHGNIDFNTWLDPLLLMRQAETVETALRQLSVPTEAELRQRSREQALMKELGLTPALAAPAAGGAQ